MRSPATVATSPGEGPPAQPTVVDADRSSHQARRHQCGSGPPSMAEHDGQGHDADADTGDGDGEAPGGRRTAPAPARATNAPITSSCTMATTMARTREVVSDSRSSRPSDSASAGSTVEARIGLPSTAARLTSLRCRGSWRRTCPPSNSANEMSDPRRRSHSGNDLRAVPERHIRDADDAERGQDQHAAVRAADTSSASRSRRHGVR